MFSARLKFAATSAVAILGTNVPMPDGVPATESVGLTMESVSRMTIGANGVLYLADPKAAKIYAVELPASSAKTGTKEIPGFLNQVAAMSGTSVDQISLQDIAVDPRNGNSYVAVMRGSGGVEQPLIVRADGEGKVDVVAVESLKVSSVALPSPPAIDDQMRYFSVTHMAFSDGRLYVAGLSNEEFSSKFWSVPYPFAALDKGTGVEMFHGSHGGLETNAPILAFVPYRINNEPYVIAGYLCTPLVKFPISALQPGGQVTATTIAELGAGNQPLDMVLYNKDGKDYVLLSNSTHGMMKLPAEQFATEPAITEPVDGLAGVPYETIDEMASVTRFDQLDATHIVTVLTTPDEPGTLKTFLLP